MNDKTEVLSRILREDLFLLCEKEHFAGYIALLGRLHKCRIRNTVLLYFQKPEASFVAGYYTWRDRYHRSVRKGEKALTILSPKGSFTDPSQYRTSAVFDLSQTAGAPLPQHILPHPDPSPEDPSLLLEAAVLGSVLPVYFKDIPTETDGFFRPVDKDLIIRKDMSFEKSFYTLIRESARARLYAADPVQTPEAATVRDHEAKCIAYAVSSYFGIYAPEPEEPVNRTDKEEMLASFERIRSTASLLISSISRIRFPPPEASAGPLVFQ